MQITWTNCAEQMPPNTMKFKLIYRVNSEITFGFGTAFNVIADIHPRWEEVKCKFEWTPYTDEKWKELNK